MQLSGTQLGNQNFLPGACPYRGLLGRREDFDGPQHRSHLNKNIYACTLGWGGNFSIVARTPANLPGMGHRVDPWVMPNMAVPLGHHKAALLLALPQGGEHPSLRMDRWALCQALDGLQRG